MSGGSWLEGLFAGDSGLAVENRASVAPAKVEVESDEEPVPEKTRRQLRAALSNACSEPGLRLDIGAYKKDESMLTRAVADLHKKIPRQVFLEWFSSVQGVVQDTPGCSGSDIWMHCWQALLAFWRSEYDMANNGILHSFAAEISEKKQKFLLQQFDIPTLIRDVDQLKDQRVWNLVSQTPAILPWTDFFAGGFSCKGNSKQNAQRKFNKGCIKAKETSSGITFEAMRAHLVKARPRIAFLENVPEVQQGTDMLESDAQYIQTSLAEEGFTVVPIVFNCREYGSAAERVRWWALVFDVRPEYSDQVTANARRMIAALKIPSYPVEKFLLPDDLIEAACDVLGSSESNKRAKGDVNWKYVHEKARGELKQLAA